MFVNTGGELQRARPRPVVASRHANRHAPRSRIRQVPSRFSGSEGRLRT